MRWVSRLLVQRVCAFALAQCCCMYSAFAQDTRVTLHSTVAFDDKPDRAYVAVSQRGEVVSIAPAVVVEHEKEKSVEVVGQVFLSGDSHDSTALFVVIGKNGSVGSVVGDRAFVAGNAGVASSRDALRVQLQEKSVELRQKEAQVREQKQSLKRLQEDTDAIGKVESLAAAEDALENLKGDVARLTEAFTLVQSRLAGLRELSPPATARRREAELAAELQAISVALKSTEADSLKRVSHASQELTSNLALIESTKNEHIDLLQNELRSLIREREVLESGRR